MFFGIAVLMAAVLVSFRNTDGPYRFPLSTSVLLAGTFGELRPNHFHSGLDIKTPEGEGQPVFCIEDGYVYRIKVSTYGFGKAVYIKHPDGRFSVYGHLSNFSKNIADLVYQKQYASKKFEQEIYLPANQISFYKGDIIAYTGNSGHSLGPHLHFEIRESDDRIIDPLRFYRERAKDHIPPIVRKLAFEPLETDSRINGIFKKMEYVPVGENGSYVLPEPVLLTGKCGIEFEGIDKMEVSNNQLGINFVKVFLDEELIFEYRLEKFSFDDRRYINVHTDYAWYMRTQKRLERCYLEYGNELGAYTHVLDRGVIDLKDEKIHFVRMEFSDLSGNTTLLRARIKKGN